MATEGIVTEGLADQGTEAVKGLAEVGRLGAQEDADGRRQAQHGASSRVRRSSQLGVVVAGRDAETAATGQDEFEGRWRVGFVGSNVDGEERDRWGDRAGMPSRCRRVRRQA